MAWETRGKRRYYYRKEWNRGRVRSVYAGAGDRGELWASLDALERGERDAARQIEQEHRYEIETAEARAQALAQIADAAAKALLLAAGCHTHKRQWRRGRGPRRQR